MSRGIERGLKTRCPVSHPTARMRVGGGGDGEAEERGGSERGGSERGEQGVGGPRVGGPGGGGSGAGAYTRRARRRWPGRRPVQPGGGADGGSPRRGLPARAAQDPSFDFETLSVGLPV